MNENKTPQTIEKQPHKQNVKRWLWPAITVVLIVGIGVVWWWQQSRLDDTSAQLKNQRKITDGLTQENQRLKTASQKPDVVTYTAKVGKFSLSLPTNYVVVVNNDGGAEGGPFTGIEIDDTTSSYNVVGSSLFGVSLTASQLVHTFREEVDNDLSDKGPTKQASIKFDGVEAEVYAVGGLAAPKLVFFTKNNIFYKIELGDTNTETNKKLDALVAGFKFN